MGFDTLRIFLHLLAAAVWVGGQLVLAVLMPKIRRFDGAAKVVAGAYARVAWLALGVLWLTGMWSLLTVDSAVTGTAANGFDELDLNYYGMLLLKIIFAVVSGAAAAAHALSNRKVIVAAGGVVGLLAALGAMFTGVILSEAA